MAPPSQELEPPINPERFMVLDKALEETKPTCLREDIWSLGMVGSLATPRGFFKEPGEPEVLAMPASLAARGGFEVSDPSKVALWHGGFVEATERFDSIVEWLSGADESVLKA
jgi:hypothetical protein